MTTTIVATKTAFGWAALNTATGEYSDTCDTRREAQSVATTWAACLAEQALVVRA